MSKPPRHPDNTPRDVSFVDVLERVADGVHVDVIDHEGSTHHASRRHTAKTERLRDKAHAAPRRRVKR